MNTKIFWAALAFVAVLGCKPEKIEQDQPGGDDSPEQPVVVPLTAPVLTASVTEITLDSESDEEAVKLTWTSAGEGASYKLEAGTATPAVYTVAGLEKSLSHRDIASLGEPPFNIVFKVKASADGKSDVWSNSVTVAVSGDSTPVVPPTPTFPEHLYIYFWAWDNATNAQEMTKVSDGVFSWTGDCGPWQFKFLTARNVPDDYGTGYSRDENASDYWTMKPTVGGDDATFELNHDSQTAGNFTITANLNTMKVSYVRNATPLPEHLFVYAWAWTDATNAKEMTALGDGKFTWSGVLPDDNIKFTTSNAESGDYWTGYFRDPDADDYWTLKESSTQVMFSPKAKGFRDGWITLNVDLNTLKVEFIPHVWLVGPAILGNWDLPSARPDDNVEMIWLGDGAFTWTGHVTPGLFKFLVVSDNWYGYWRNSTETEYWLAGVRDNPDDQFDISHDGLEEGNYKIDLNIFTHAVTVTSVEADD